MFERYFIYNKKRTLFYLFLFTKWVKATFFKYLALVLFQAILLYRGE
jgi:hypothetical protein